MRPPSVYAKRACPAGDPCDMLGLLHGPHRVGYRLVMVLLSQQGRSPAQVAGLLGCDPSTVRRWIHRNQRHAATGLSDRPRRPPRLAAKGDPDRDQVLASLHQQLRDPPTARSCWPRTRPTSTCCPGCAPPGSPRHPPAGHDPGTNRRRTVFGAVDLVNGQWFYQVTRKAISASFTALCEQLLAAHPRLRVLHGARYSPHDNPTERIWAALKAWLANSPTLTIQGRVRQVHAFFRQRAPAQMLATAAPHSSPRLGRFQASPCDCRLAWTERSTDGRHRLQQVNRSETPSKCRPWCVLAGRPSALVGLGPPAHGRAACSPLPGGPGTGLCRGSRVTEPDPRWSAR